MEPSFENLLVHLAKAQIDFLLVGGLAVALNGYPRMTEDVDLWVNPEPENIEKLIQALKHYGQGFGGELRTEDFSDEPGAIRINESFSIDLFVQMNGMRYDEIVQHRSEHELSSLVIPYVDAEGLIKIKSGSHREKDLLDISVLKQILKAI